MISDYSNPPNLVTNDYALLVCDSECSTIQEFVSEYFHPDNGGYSASMTICTPNEPTQFILGLMTQYSGLNYMKGDVLELEDLKKLKTDKARAIFLLCNRASQESDSITVWCNV